MKKKSGVKILLSLTALALLLSGNFAQAAVKDNAANQDKCKSAMRVSFTRSVESVEKTYATVSTSLNSLTAMGINLTAAQAQAFASVPEKINTLKAHVSDLLATSDANGSDCLRGTGEVHSKSVAVKAEMAEIKGLLLTITGNLSALSSINRTIISRYDKNIQYYETRYGVLSQRISSTPASSVTDEVKYFQSDFLQKIANYKVAVTELKKYVADTYNSGDRVALRAITLSIAKTSDKNEKIPAMKNVRAVKSSVSTAYSNLQRVMIKAGVTVLGPTSTNKATGITVDTKTGEEI